MSASDCNEELVCPADWKPSDANHIKCWRREAYHEAPLCRVEAGGDDHFDSATPPL